MRNLDPEHASYFLSRSHITPTSERNIARQVEHFALPGERTVEVGSQIPL